MRLAWEISRVETGLSDKGVEGDFFVKVPENPPWPPF